MIGEIITAEIGAIPEEKDKKGNVIQESVAGTNFDICKGGVSKALECEGVFYLLMEEAGAKNKDGFYQASPQQMLKAFNEKTIPKIKKIIIENVQAPVINQSSFEEIKKSHILPLFMEIYDMYSETATEKKTSTKD